MNKLIVNKGDRFGKLTILKENYDKFNRRAFDCICDCGNIITVRLCSLTMGRTKSCGCLKEVTTTYNKDRTKRKCWRCGRILSLDKFYKNKSKHDGLCTECKECCNEIASQNYHNKYDNIEFDLSFRYSHCKSSAKKRGKEFRLTIKEFDNITSKPCYICGKYTNGNKYTGIDRLNNEIGYIKENCIPCCDKCNRLKYTHSLEEIFQHLTDIYKYQKNGGNDLCL
jgi:hypothetical protein